jgi:F-type H+-transporting ATPase subunit delta
MKTNKKFARAARQLYRLCLVNATLDEGRVRQTAHRIAQSKRRGTLPILASFQRLVRLDRDRHTAIVESATALSDPLQQGIRADLKRLYGDGLDMTFRPSPALIGGIRIKVGSNVYDGSVRGRLAALQARW